MKTLQVKELTLEHLQHKPPERLRVEYVFGQFKLKTLENCKKRK